MIKKTLVGLALAATCITTASADPKIGVGMALTSEDTTIRVPIDIDTQLRIEPEFSFGYVSGDNGFSNSSFGIGTGVYMLAQPEKSINMYFGGKIGFKNESTSSNTNNLVNAINLAQTGNGGSSFYLAPAAGFEYFLHPKVSLGGEASFTFGFGDFTNIGLTTATTLRYYF